MSEEKHTNSIEPVGTMPIPTIIPESTTIEKVITEIKSEVVDKTNVAESTTVEKTMKEVKSEVVDKMNVDFADVKDEAPVSSANVESVEILSGHEAEAVFAVETVKSEIGVGIKPSDATEDSFKNDADVSESASMVVEAAPISDTSVIAPVTVKFETTVQNIALESVSENNPAEIGSIVAAEVASDSIPMKIAAEIKTEAISTDTPMETVSEIKAEAISTDTPMDVDSAASISSIKVKPAQNSECLAAKTTSATSETPTALASDGATEVVAPNCLTENDADDSLNVPTKDTDGTTQTPGKEKPVQETLKRGDEGFTSEIYRIKVDSLPKFTSVAAFKKKLGQLGLKPIKVSVQGTKQYPYSFVTFENEDNKQKALKVLNDTTWKNNNIYAIHAAPKKGTQLVGEKRPGDRSTENDQRAKRPKSTLPLHEQINDKVAAYWRYPYDQQLLKKDGIVKSVMNDWKRDLRKAGVDWVNASPLCPVESIIPSKVIKGYRNKCEFSLGQSAEGEVHVGFLLGRSADGTNVVRPTECPLVSEGMKAVCLHFEKFITEMSKLPIYNTQERTGHWRLLLVRETHAGEIMIVAQMHPQKLSTTEITEQGKLLGVHFSENFPEGNVKSISLQCYEGISHGFGSDIQLVHGPPVLEETLMGLKFDISPTSFFQVNYGGAENLYSLIRQWAGETKKLGAGAKSAKERDGKAKLYDMGVHHDGNAQTDIKAEKDGSKDASKDSVLRSVNVLDVCCGTGTIGMLMAPVANKVFGVDIVESAIEDAKKNALKNEMKNIEFVCGKAEDTLGKLVNTALLENMGLMGILDPPRAGLHKDVVKVIRATPQIDRLVYVACDARQSLPTLTSLCRPTSNNYIGLPFRPMRVAAADLFPNTPNFEFIVLLERESTN
ncbi:hypothetical protein, variant [Sphaeroforma arctica JP610]|uniref:Methyltransferase domain-containing protein n=1 Tax=Sphaeroforma arctica JP610 TaxID=667725 RepID=A0A0L0GAB3_9EUKA|nr:hypothetical protein, variant [Sphaeroforma arctica JP610]KNC85821.1 hypothetical protein, variant [Sphaeroforma arctica JP610]|eukprot:XP_014159723.1 hypothetical protein, variant [Sphaeroforma arctica JP610]